MGTLPNYFRDVDFERIFRYHPLPEEFVDTIYQWPRGKIEEMQEERFLSLIRDAWENPFYRRLWTAHGVSPADIKGLHDLQKLPVFSVYDFKDSIQRCPPFGEHQGVSVADARRIPLKIQSSGGTTGKPRPTFFGPVEWEVQAIQTARALYLQGARPGDVLQIPATLSTANFAWCYYRAAHMYMGVVPVTTGSGVVTPSRRQLETAREWGANLWASFPEYMLHLAEVAQEELGWDVRDFGTKFITSFLGPDLEGALRRQMSEVWGCAIYDNYGTHEIGLASFECPAQDGLHFMEDTIIAEVVDIDTSEPVPVGEKGNLVATILHRRHPPLIRYNLMDCIRLLPPGRCACGSHLLRMDHFLGRSDDMVKLRGTNLYPMACLAAIKAEPGTTGEWLCVVDRIGDGTLNLRDEMTVRVECVEEGVRHPDLKESLERRLLSDLGVRVSVELVPAGSLAPLTNYGGEGKVRRLLDRRYKK